MGRDRFGELEEQGFLTSRVGTSAPERGGRPRGYCRVVEDAVLPTLADSRRARLAWCDGLEPLLDES